MTKEELTRLVSDFLDRSERELAELDQMRLDYNKALHHLQKYSWIQVGSGVLFGILIGIGFSDLTR